MHYAEINQVGIMLFKGVIQVEMVGYDGLASLGLFIIFSLELQGATPWHSLSDITLKTQKSKSYNFQFDMCPNDCHHIIDMVVEKW